MFTGSKDRACDRESREDHGKRKWRNHSGSRRDEQRGQGRYDGYTEEIPGSTQEDETSKSWPDHSVWDSTRDRKQEPRIQELEEDVDQQTSAAAMQGRGRGIRGFVEQLCGEGGDVYEGWTASERKRSWSVCRRLETGSKQWIGQRTLFKLVGQGGLAQSGQDDSSSNIRQGNAGLKCVSLNARSIMNKKSELNIMVNDSDPHIIGESWANKDITDAELGLEGYVMFRKDRMGRRGGGVLLYVKDTIPAYEIQLREEADCEEAIWCKLVTGHKTVTMGVVYRCPNITKESNEKIQNAIREVSKGDCIIMGDFNHGNIQWDTLESTGVEDQQFMCLIQDNFLIQHVLEPTRGGRVLDLVLSSQKEFVDNVKIQEPLGSSDHNQLHFNIKIKSDKTKVSRCKRNFRKGNYKEMRTILEHIDWNDKMKNKTGAESWNI